MNVEANVDLSGRYKLVKRKLTGELVEELEFPNIITDIGLNRWGTGSIGDLCRLGAGNTTPSASDTGLASTLLTTTNVVGSGTRAYSVAERWTEITRVFRFTPGVTVNSIAEMGVGWSSGLWSRALIRDAQGNPTTVQILSDEVLDVYYTLRMQFPAADITGQITLDGVLYNWTLRPAGIAYVPYLPASWFTQPFGNYSQGSYGGASSSPLVGVDGNLSQEAASSATAAPYVENSKAQRVTYEFGVGVATFTIKTVTFLVTGNYGHETVKWQIGFANASTGAGIPKNSAQRLRLTPEFSWGRG